MYINLIYTTTALFSLYHIVVTDTYYMSYELLVGCTALCGECNNLDKCDECAYENMYKDTVEGVTTCHGESTFSCLPVHPPNPDDKASTCTS